MSEVVLTVRMPWAGAMFATGDLRKNIENRTWKTAFRGRLAIHVAGRLDPDGYDMLGEEPTAEDRRRLQHVIGTVNLVDVHPAGSDGCAKHGCYGSVWAFWNVPGDPDLIKRPRVMYHWVLENPREFVTPIAASGRLQLWESGPTLSGQIRDAEVRA